MRIWGLSDLHLSFSTNKPMDVFGDHWLGHAGKMAAAWDATVHDDDVVLCPGDLSWANRLDEAAIDLAWIGARKGRLKILTRGNHDYWWSAIGKVRSALPAGVVALQNDAIDVGDVVVCGSRLWSCPGALDWDAHDEKIYLREVERLKLSLQAAKKLAGERPLVAAIHYPPFDRLQQETAYSRLLRDAGVQLCVYGHLHGRRAHKTAFVGDRDGCRFHLIACDALDFRPLQVWPPLPAPAATTTTTRGAPVNEASRDDVPLRRTAPTSNGEGA
jgi:predicted phosphohydrolase